MDFRRLQQQEMTKRGVTKWKIIERKGKDME